MQCFAQGCLVVMRTRLLASYGLIEMDLVVLLGTGLQRTLADGQVNDGAAWCDTTGVGFS